MNFIVICLDTLRRDGLGCYRSDWIQTPQIDAFAANAVRFTEARCGSFPTIPQRVDAITGEVNWPRYGWRAPDPEQPLLPKLLEEAGYSTALVTDTKHLFNAGLDGIYRDSVLIEKDVDDGVTRDDIEIPVPKENLRQDGTLYVHDRACWSHYRYEDDWFVSRTMREACRWLEDNAGKSPFFLWVDSFEIHEDWMPPSYYLNLYERGYTGRDYTYPNYGYTDIYTAAELEHLRAAYAAEVTLTDRWTGHLLRQIELMGLHEDTCVMLTSDHGMYIGEHGRCGKHTVNPTDPWPIYDTVGMVPLLVRMPRSGRIDDIKTDNMKTDDIETVNCEANVQAADIAPTVLELAGLSVTEGAGRSFAPALRGESYTGHQAVYTSYHSLPTQGRIGYLRSCITVTEPEFTLVVGPDGRPPELYDRSSDPGCTKNIAVIRPAEVRRMKEELIAFMQAQEAPEQYISEYVV